ncbi:sensor histidine kinase [Clostridium puniceum]|uniref:sensor histidine kinase n=1 Tax=Clostridium puniceum TaxID=29367 RepID=UPI00130157C1|nr:HAMP domain-containing sensor histidine kinase [Clostridium puniceum]
MLVKGGSVLIVNQHYITDSIIIIDENLIIKEVNNIFYEKFKPSKKREYQEYRELIRDSSLKSYEDLLTDLINKANTTRTNQSTQIKVIAKEVTYFEVQVNCVIVKGDYFGTIVFIKDITASKRNMELMIEKDRLMSLSQLIGGVAHNLKTPIMSVSGGLAIIKKDINKLDTYLGNYNNQDIKKLITEINLWNERGQAYLCYMTDIINAIKNQLKDFEQNKSESFIIENLIKDTILLMSYELKKNQCKLIQEINIDDSMKIVGDINSLIQVLDNLISNAISAVKYNRNVILSVYKENKNIIFSVSNEGNIIPDQVQKKIFKEMVTTKGKAGTGVGLYISKSIIKSRFEGDMYFKSDNEKTTFFIKIPIKEQKNEQRNEYSYNRR